MEANICDVNHLDADVLLPPRKRLLAGLKKQNSDGNSYMPSTSSSLNEYDDRLNKLLRSHLNNDNLSEEEIVEASRSAAEAALKVAEAARAAADEKAIIAAKAVAAAKSALELVANVSEDTASNERYLKKNKLKKHVQVQMLYSNNNKNRSENCKTDEELARTLHRAINSSPRISKHCSPSDLKSHKHKRLKSLAFSEMMPDSNPSTSNGNIVAGEVDGGSSNEKEANMVKVDESTKTFNKADTSKMENAEAERINSKEKYGEEDTSSLGRKRGRMKQKKLPLSICNFRDQENPKEEVKYRSSRLSEEDTGKAAAATKKPLFSVGPSGNGVMPVERTTSLWKCQSFKAPTCVKQNKVVQS